MGRRKKKQKGSVLICLGILFILAGVLFACYNLYDDYRAKSVSQEIVGMLDALLLPEGQPVAAGVSDVSFRGIWDELPEGDVGLDVPMVMEIPTSVPTAATEVPTGVPSVVTEVPTGMPTEATGVPTGMPTEATGVPTGVPSAVTAVPTGMPTEATDVPTGVPTMITELPTGTPLAATERPSDIPTATVSVTKPSATAGDSLTLPSVEPVAPEVTPFPTEKVSDTLPTPVVTPGVTAGTPVSTQPASTDPPVSTPVPEIEIPDYVLNPKMEMPVKRINGQDYIGILEIPVLELKLPVISKWTYPRLKIAPCRYTGSAYTNNLVISAHNYASHFGNLSKLFEGAAVIFTDMDGNVFNYRVDRLETLGPYDIEYMKSGDWDLTLFTCTPGGSYRVTIRCVAVFRGY